MATPAGYCAVQVTLTNADTNYSLYDLLRAVQDNCPGVARQVLVQSDLANDSASLVSVGDENMSGTRYGYQMSPGDMRIYDNIVRITEMYLRGSDAGLKVNVEVTA